MIKHIVRPALAALVPGIIATLTAMPTVIAASNIDIDIPYTKFVLDNGLTVIVSEDHKAPIVAVNVWYHVGSKNEKPGKTGFAHLFEHLMFNGSENFNDDYFKPFDRVGATDMNGTTNFDRTNYFQNVPSTALDMALWMESDRMGHLLGAIDQARLDEQRGVVQNEKRQGENQPYGKAFLNIFENTYPKGHPYSWSVIGSMEDLDAASLDDVHQWFKDYYGPANAVIAVVGDVDTEDVREKMVKYFGDIPSGPPVARQEAWPAKRTGIHRQTLQDRVPQARIYKVWNMPEWGSADSDYLNMVSDLLCSGKTSRLYKRLVYEDQIATDVVGFAWERELGGLFVVWATAQPGQDLAEVERAMDEEIERFLRDGPTRREVERVKTQQLADFVRGIERIGGFGGKSDILALNEVYGGDPGHYRRTLERRQSATARDLEEAARRWLSDGQYILEIHPFPEYGTVASVVDRSSGVPETESFPEVSFPRIQRATLSNGLEVVLAERHVVPVVEFNLLLDAGFAADQPGIPGTASLAMNTLDEGTQRRSALEISEELSLLGAELNTGSNLDVSSVSLSALVRNLDRSLDVYADVILNPSFPEGEFERLRREQLARIQREQATPFNMALRVLPRLVYGDNHAYGTPFTGSGTEASVASLSRDDLRKFHETWFRPNNGKMIVVGSTTLDEILPKLEERFAGWKSQPVPVKNVERVEHRSSSPVYLIDRPESIQSLIIAGHIAPPTANPDEIAIETMNGILGGSFTARINMNLREDKHWTYGARSVFVDAKGQRPFFVYASVQSDKTKEAMAEIQKELEGIAGDNPATAGELARVKDRNTLSLPGRWETSRRVSGSIAEIVRFSLPDDYWSTYPRSVRALTLEEVNRVAADVIRPRSAVWVVVGDRTAIEPGIRELGLGEIVPIDADGNRLEPPRDKTELRP
jgi:zinc protease